MDALVGWDEYLYKVAAPRPSGTFAPSTFWRSADWESSSDRYRPGYHREAVLYAGDRHEIDIHLVPRGRTLRVRQADVDPHQRRELGLTEDAASWLFVHREARDSIERFWPSVFLFERHGFRRVRRGEYVADEPQRAVFAMTVRATDALQSLGAMLVHCDDVDAIAAQLSGLGVYFDLQT